MKWDPPLAIFRNGIIREYRVLVTNLKTGENQTHAFSLTEGIIGFLTPSYQFSFSVSAFTVAESPYSTAVNITMPEDGESKKKLATIIFSFHCNVSLVPSGFPQNFQGSSYTPNAISLSWSPPATNEQNGEIIQYIINVTHADTIQYFTKNTFINIAGLDPYTTYVCVAAAETKIGIGPFSNVYTVQTQEDGKSACYKWSIIFCYHQFHALIAQLLKVLLFMQMALL